MNRKLVAVGLTVVMSLALFAMPAGAYPAVNAPSIPPKVARIAPAGGILTKARLSVSGTSSSDVPQLTWNATRPMRQAVEEAGGCAFVMGKVYCPGGYIEFNVPTLYSNTQILTVSTSRWAVDSEPMPAAPPGGGWADAAVCANPVDRTIHVVNGVDGTFLYAAHQVYSTTVPLGSRWSFKSLPMLADGTIFYSQDSGCAFIGGQMYLFGGYGVVGSSVGIQRITWKWDPATDTWTDTGFLMRSPRLWMGYTNNASAIWAVGGTDDLTTFNPVETTEQFSATRGWRNGASLGADLGRLAPGLSLVGTTLYQYGGGTWDPVSGLFTIQGSTLQCASNCPRTGGSWVDTGANMITARWFHGWATGTVSTNLFYAAGGDDGLTILSDAEKFTIP